jgi:hypothetical protein
VIYSLKTLENKYSQEVSELTRQNAILSEKCEQMEEKLKSGDEQYK